mgnify:CR=1 FL=1|jgi:dolichol-phosphate mannosyltransferase|tara:strand:+ start:4007 stop:4729 length:723 start_codon:yes stop_codon:yes gene_type:complete
MFVSIVIPTYNEAENIENLLEEISNSVDIDELEILVVDDNSPDKTWEIVKNYETKLERPKKSQIFIKVIRREKKEGIINALLDGIDNAKGENILVMDADFSHSPKYIPKLINELTQDNECDIVIGSRYIKDGQIEGWSIRRYMVSSIATFLARLILKIEVQDVMNGFFLFRKRLLHDFKFTTKGQKFLLELLVKAKYNKTKEIPIKFINRTAGKSKLDSGDIKNFISSLIELRRWQKNQC